MVDPNPNIRDQWSAEEQTWYRDQWNPQDQTWYRFRHNPTTEEWQLLGGRRDSVIPPAYAGPSNAGPANNRGIGNPIQGTYNAAHPLPDTHFESLDPSFYVREPSFFQEGRLFSVLFIESAGQNSNHVTNYNDALTYYNNNDALSFVRFGELAHSQVRRFICVRRKLEFCYAVPIFTYGNQGTLKSGVRPQEHAVAYSYGCTPNLMPGEDQLSKSAICIVMNLGQNVLAQASRIYFGIQHPIQYNVKVKDLGYVHPDWMPAFLGYWNMENGAVNEPPMGTQ